MGMGIGIVTGHPLSRRVIGMERHGQVGMVTLAHQVNLLEESGVEVTMSLHLMINSEPRMYPMASYNGKTKCREMEMGSVIVTS